MKDPDHGEKLQEDWQIVFDGTNQLSCSDRALVLHSLDIPHQTMATLEGRFLVLVPPGNEI